MGWIKLDTNFTIRYLNEDDMDKVAELLEKGHRHNTFKKGINSFDLESSKRTLVRILSAGMGTYLGYFKKSSLIGVICLVHTPSCTDNGFIMSEICAWQAAHEISQYKKVKVMIRLLDELITIINNFDVKIRTIHCTFINKKLLPLLQKRGFSYSQYHLIKEVS